MRRRAVAVLAAALALVIGCTDRPGTTDSPPPASAPPAASPPPGPGTAGGTAQEPALPRAIDWGALERNPVVTRLGTWHDYVEAEKVCLDASEPSARCKNMQRALYRAGGAANVDQTITWVRDALPALRSLWAKEFEGAGRTFVQPNLEFYGVNVQGKWTIPEQPPMGCPKLWDNSLYCPATATVYLDAVYLARLAAAVHESEGTSGRYASIAVAAHEIGHAVHYQLYKRLEDADQELLADCFAGHGVAGIRAAESGSRSQSTRLLESVVPLSEGQLGMFLLGGPRMVDAAHAAGPARASYFTRGFNDGVASCIALLDKPPAKR